MEIVMADKVNIEDLNRMIREASNKSGADPQKVEKALESNSMDNLLKNLKPDAAKKLQKVLSDKDATERMLKTPQAQMLLKKFLEKNDG